MCPDSRVGIELGCRTEVCLGCRRSRPAPQSIVLPTSIYRTARAAPCPIAAPLLPHCRPTPASQVATRRGLSLRARLTAFLRYVRFYYLPDFSSMYNKTLRGIIPGIKRVRVSYFQTTKTISSYFLGKFDQRLHGERENDIN